MIYHTNSLLTRYEHGTLYEAEAKTVAAGHASVSWKGKGVIDDLGDGNRVFGGTITGIILVKHLPEGSAPAEIHAGKLDVRQFSELVRTTRNGIRPSAS